MRPTPSLRTVASAAVVSALLAGCGSGLPPVPTDPTWSHTTAPPTSEIETTPPPTTEVLTSTALDVDAAVPRRRAVPVARPRPAVTTTAAAPTTTDPTTTSTPTTTTPTTTKRTATSEKPTDGAHPFGSCAEARAAGAAPLLAGQPGYNHKLDSDGDGVACEV